ncbi:MAG: hypothetical protein ACKN9V_00825, partial [Pseudomonadota bacterium]
MITYKDWFSFLALVNSFLSLHLWGFSFELNKHSIQIGETAILSISLPTSTKDRKVVVLDDLLYGHPELKILERNMNQRENETILTFEITSYQAKDYRIPPIQVKWGSDTFSTEALDLAVTTSRLAEDTEIRPEFGTLEPPFPWRKVYLGLLLFFGMALSFWIIRWSFLRIPWHTFRRFSWRFKYPSFETDRMWLRKELDRLRQEVQKGKCDAKLVDQIFYTLKVFFERRTHSPALALTQRELEAQLPNKLLSQETKSILSEGDRFKFQTV